MQEANLQKVYLSLGSNLGNRIENLRAALQALEKNVGTIDSLSKIYETAPWGKLDQAGFLNLVVCIRAFLPNPMACLTAIQAIEQSQGRQRVEKWGERTIDIDILYWEDVIVCKHELTIPHPLMQYRKFVLVPLADIAPEFIHPILRENTRTLLDKCPDEGAIDEWL